MLLLLLSRFSWVQICVTPWTVAHQAPLCMGLSSKNTGMGCHDLLQGIFPTQGLNPGLLQCRQTLYPWTTRKDRQPLCSYAQQAATTWHQPIDTAPSSCYSDETQAWQDVRSSIPISKQCLELICCPKPAVEWTCVNIYVAARSKLVGPDSGPTVYLDSCLCSAFALCFLLVMDCSPEPWPNRLGLRTSLVLPALSLWGIWMISWYSPLCRPLAEAVLWARYPLPLQT